jgi:hypothetical protein
LARITKTLAANHKQSQAAITTSSGLAGGFEVMGKPFEYDAELMEKARWIVELGLHRQPEHHIERQLELPLPMPPREPKNHN